MEWGHVQLKSIDFSGEIIFQIMQVSESNTVFFQADPSKTWIESIGKYASRLTRQSNLTTAFTYKLIRRRS